jgi:c-di-GMP-binding flagellar brake protein YcgR
MNGERRGNPRIAVQQQVSISLGNGGDITGITENISRGGAFLYCDRFILLGTKLRLLLVLPEEMNDSGSVQASCLSKIVRLENQLKEGKFGIALEFLNIETFPRA